MATLNFHYQLDDRYTLKSGRIYLSGIQALVRLPLMQAARDRAAGLKTAAFISGYRGSPLGGFDQALWKAEAHLRAANVHFEPGINEDLGATAVWGSQQVNLFDGAKYDGVFGMWYGKGPGVDRSSDVFKHANAAGSSRFGGVLAVGGDDHACKSSTLPHQSEFAYADFMMPVLNPAGLQEVLDYGLYGWALSRYSGCWVAFKMISDTADSSASVDADPERVKIITPADFMMPEGGLNIRWPDPPHAQEERLHRYKIPAAQAFTRANQLDKLIWPTPQARLVIISTGKSYLDMRQALKELGIDEARAGQLGIRLYKVAMPWPLEPEGIKAAVAGVEEVLVIEEKRPLIENQIKEILYHMPANARPVISGKTTPEGKPLLISTDELTPVDVAGAFLSRLKDVPADIAERFARVQHLEQSIAKNDVGFGRVPFYCSGCPHNTSTKVPEGSRALAGIGCHYMVMWMERNTHTFSQMGGEGVPWIGQAPFTETQHVFANLGDGTYYHSGLLAIRAACAANVSITFKILYNDAVAMTGGQPVEGHLTVPQITQQLAAEGVQRIAVVSDEPEKYPLAAGFAKGITLHHRDDMENLQKDFRELKGVSAIVYDQTCAAEKRRRRKRGTFYDPPRRIVINDLVCEGCGDCSVKSNCLSVTPLETEWGTKRQIDQSSCNKDYSCVNGFCPSFVSVIGGDLRKPKPQKALDADLPPPPALPLTGAYGILVTGIGGTGVVTIGALLTMAAHLEGKGATTMDMTGLAQKGGAVWSHVQIAPKPDDILAVRLASRKADLVLGADLVVAAHADSLSRMSPATKVVLNTHETMTADFTLHPTRVFFPNISLRQVIEDIVGKESIAALDATKIATQLMGDAIATNLFILGYAYQKGWIPVSAGAIKRAIELNEAAVSMNLSAFAWGRKAALDIKAVENLTKPKNLPNSHQLSASLGETIARRVEFLTGYQNKAYAKVYSDFVGRVRVVEQNKIPGKTAFTEAIAKNLFKLMAYKDEYEVARLYTKGDFIKQVQEQFTGDYKLKFHLAPPLIAPRDEKGHLKKITFGPWLLRAFSLLKHFRFLRGTAFDIFGYSAERKMERQLIADYKAQIDGLLVKLSAANYDMAVKLASLPEEIKGFGHVKEKNFHETKKKEKELLTKLSTGV
ncbi:MAG: indolepyruvate ferredoxin oxidoreductase family protein [Dongiaceae bacterium]